MAFYIRKSVRVGPIRFNLSKSGIGVSTGIPGLRVGTGPRGNYIHMGRGGLYYRQTLSPTKARPQQYNRPVDHQAIPSRTHGAMKAIGSGCVTEMVDSTSAALLAEIERKRTRMVWWPFVLYGTLLISTLLLVENVTLWLTTPSIILLAASFVAAYQYDQFRKRVVLMYDLDGPNLSSYEQLFAAIDVLARCGAVWHVTARGKVYDPKYHAGAGHLINRRRVSVGYCDPPYVNTNLSVPFLRLGQHSLYFLPDYLLVYAPNGVGAIPYSDVSLAADKTRFIEESFVPHDAVVVDHTWRYVNKNGGPDRRFNNNRQIPICNYEELCLTSSTGLREVLQVSRLGVSATLENAVSSVVASIEKAEAAEQQRKRIEEERRDALRKKQRTALIKTVQDSKPYPTNHQLEAALFDLLCCIMVADGRASRREKTVIRDAMTGIKSAWSDEDCSSRISSFIAEIQSGGYASVLERSMAKLPMFKQVGCEATIAKCIDMVANADKTPSERERKLCDRIRRTLGVSG
ncbi:DUF4236 domain-containing protein [bacterium]|nr:DUF4236 domain-containing protein [bacterium]